MKIVPKQVVKSCKTNKSSKQKPSLVNDEKEKMKDDLSILRQPMDIGIRGIKDLMKALAGGTEEELLLNECTIIYECKMCRNLFRSLANFISHKRVYCINTFSYFNQGFSELQNEKKPEIVEPEIVQQKEECKSSWEAIPVGKSYNLQVAQMKLDPIRMTRKRDISKIVDALNRKGGKETVKTSADLPGSIFYSDIAERVMMRRNAQQKAVVELENVSDTCNGVFQTVLHENGPCSDSMKAQVVELDRVGSRNQAILQENGKFIVTSENTNDSADDSSTMEKHKCSFCDAKFVTLETLTGHEQIHHKKRICYPCPLCKIYFATPGSVYRHLSRAHHKSEQQIRRLRCQVLSKGCERKLLQPSQKIIPNLNVDLKILEEEKAKWINNFEGSLRCGTCGKSFNRRAVLSVHLTSCKEKTLPKFNSNSNRNSNQNVSSAMSSSSTVETPVPATATATATAATPSASVTTSKTSLLIKEMTPKSTEKPLTTLPSSKSGIIVRIDYCKKLISDSSPVAFGKKPTNKSCSTSSNVVNSDEISLERSSGIGDVCSGNSSTTNGKEVESTKTQLENHVPDVLIAEAVKAEEKGKNELEGNSLVNAKYSFKKRNNKKKTEICNGDIFRICKDDSNIENEEKTESALRRTKRERTTVKNKEYIYNLKKLGTKSVRSKCVKKAVKQLNGNGSVLLLQKNLLLKNKDGTELLQIFPRLV